MSFLVWNNEADMQASLLAVNELFGCSYSDGAYVMECWDVGTKHATEDLWGFSGFKEQHLGVSRVTAMQVLVGEYEVLEYKPQDWSHVEEVNA